MSPDFEDFFKTPDFFDKEGRGGGKGGGVATNINQNIIYAKLGQAINTWII